MSFKTLFNYFETSLLFSLIAENFQISTRKKKHFKNWLVFTKGAFYLMVTISALLKSIFKARFQIAIVQDGVYWLLKTVYFCKIDKKIFEKVGTESKEDTSQLCQKPML